MSRDDDALRASYDLVAGHYAEHLFEELAGKPLDRALLDCFAEVVRGKGEVVDVGCGPGQVARALHERGLPASGIDLSDAMVEVARRLTPEVRFRQGSMLALDAVDASYAGATAFYAIVHLTAAEVAIALRELHRVLKADGRVLLSFHLGDERVHRDEWWGEKVDLDFVFFERTFIERELEAAGFVLDARIERAPYPGEHPTQRAYLLARKP